MSDPKVGIATIMHIASQQMAENCSFEDLKTELSLTDDWPIQNVRAFIQKMAEASLQEIEAVELLRTISNATEVGLTDLRKDYQRAQREVRGSYSDDLPLKISNSVLDELFASGDHLIFTNQQFWRFNGKYFETLSKEQLRYMVKPYAEKMVRGIDGYSVNGALKAACDLIEAACAKLGDPMGFNQPRQPIVNCQNGELWIDDKGNCELRPHNAESRLTYILSVEYDSKATCPLFDKALHDTFSNAKDVEGMVRHLYEIIGYIIQPDRFMTSFFVFHGGGRNGKTSVAKTLQQLISQSAICARRISDFGSNQFALGDLMGKLLLIDDDVDVDTRLPDGILKKLSENKLITGEKKHKSSQEFIATAAILMLANAYPRTADVSEGMLRRMMMVPFNRYFDKAQPNPFPDIWQNEMAGILNAALAGLKRLRERGDWLEPVDCLEARNKWLANAHPLMGFLSECVEKDTTSEMTLEAFVNRFKAWCFSEGINYTSSNKLVRENLIARGYKILKKNNQWVIQDIAVATQNAAAVDSFFGG